MAKRKSPKDFVTLIMEQYSGQGERPADSPATIFDAWAVNRDGAATVCIQQTWWTVKVRDRYGSTIYADPICINAENVTPPTQKRIENVTIGKGCGSIQDVIDEDEPGDEIVIGAATHQYLEKINFSGKNLMLRSTYPNDPAIVTATTINGGIINMGAYGGTSEASKRPEN